MDEIAVRQTYECGRWLVRLSDRQARARILVRIRRLSLGNTGDAKPVGGGVFELRIDHGPGYRVYWCRQGRSIVVLLAGGVKRSQRRDIETAKRPARRSEEE